MIRRLKINPLEHRLLAKHLMLWTKYLILKRSFEMNSCVMRTFVASAFLSLLACFDASAQAGAKIVQCDILSFPSQSVQFRGKCVFQPEGGGSFSLSAVNQQSTLFGDIAVVNVTVVEKGLAEVSGLVIDKTGGGHTSRWGQARRSIQDKSCWDGADFRICAR